MRRNAKSEHRIGLTPVLHKINRVQIKTSHIRHQKNNIQQPQHFALAHVSNLRAIARKTFFAVVVEQTHYFGRKRAGKKSLSEFECRLLMLRWQ